MEIDSTLADAYAELGAYRGWVEWDWEGAEQALQQALRLNPNLAAAHQGYSLFLCIMGRAEEALPHIELAVKLNPLEPMMHHFYGQVLGYNGRYNDAIAAYRAALEIAPNLGMALGGLAQTLDRKGKHDEALVVWRKRYADDAELAQAYEDGFERAGYKGAYRAVADLMAEWYGKPGMSVRPYGIANRYLVAGEYDLAIDWFEKAFEELDTNMPYIGGPSKDPLRSYPRFQELLRKMNLPVDEKE